MPLSTVDTKPALVLIDLQKGLRNVPAVPPLAEVVDRATELATGFRKRGFPVVLVNVTGQPSGRTQQARRSGGSEERPADFADIFDELGAEAGDLRVTKQAWGAFYNTDLDAQLQGLGVTQVFVGGIATSLGVESTARSAHEHGYHVVLATDAMTDPDAEAHANSLTRVFPRLGETATTAEILAKLEG
jgi:nicotinamidase-related amidase